MPDVPPPTLESLAAAVAGLQGTIAELRAENAELSAENAELRSALEQSQAECGALRAELATLRDAHAEVGAKAAAMGRRLARDSSNSSSPPSKDVGKKKRRKRKKSSKKPGGQPGHVGHGRKKLPDELITERVPCFIAPICVCGHDDVVGRAFRTSHDVLGVRGIIRFELESARCNACRRRRTAPLPAGITRSVVGSDLAATIGHMSGIMGVPRRPMQQFLDDVLGRKLALGTLSKREAELADALEAPMKEAHDEAAAAPVKHIDETSHRNRGLRRTAWVLSTLLVTVLMLGLRRGRQALGKVLQGASRGIFVTDRYAVYDVLGSRRQLCLEHIRRNFLGVVSAGGDVGLIGLRCASATRRVLVAWRDHRRGRLDEQRYHSIVARCRRRIESELARGWQQDPELRTLAYAFIVTPQIVWRFVEDRSVPPTNNQGERDIRGLVVRRKVQLHTWSERGDRYVERMLTVGGTCRKRGKNPYAFLVEAVRAHRAGVPAPRLLAT